MGNTLEEWVILAQNNFPGMVGEERVWYPLQRLNSVPRHLFKIQTTPPHRDPVLLLAQEPIMVVTMPGVADTFKTVINKMTHGIDSKRVNLLLAENVTLTQQDQKTSIHGLENRWNIHLVSGDGLTSRAKPSSNGRLSHCWWSFGISDKSHQYKTKNTVGWRFATDARIGFNHQVTSTPGFHSLYDWCHQAMWLFSGAPEDPEDETVMEKHGADGLYSTVKSSMHAIRTEGKNAPHEAAHRTIQIAMPWTFRRWSDSKSANGKPLVQLLKENAHLVDLEWTEDRQPTLKTLVERYTSWGASGVSRVHRSRLAWFSLVLGDTEDWNDDSGRLYNKWPPDTGVDSAIF